MNRFCGGRARPQGGHILNQLLSHFYLTAPKLVFIPASCERSPVHELRKLYTFPLPDWNKEDVPEAADLLPEYSSVVKVLTNLVELGFLDLKIETDYILNTPDPSIERSEYAWESFCSYFKGIDHIVFADILAKLCESEDAKIVELEPHQKRDDYLEREYPIRVTYSITKDGWEAAMAVTAHNDSEAVRLASISSAKTAKIALWIAGCIAVGSVGGLILKAYEMFYPYF